MHKMNCSKGVCFHCKINKRTLSNKYPIIAPDQRNISKRVKLTLRINTFIYAIKMICSKSAEELFGLSEG